MPPMLRANHDVIRRRAPSGTERAGMPYGGSMARLDQGPEDGQFAQRADVPPNLIGPPPQPTAQPIPQQPESRSQRRQQKVRSKRRRMLEWPVLIVVAVAIALLIRTFVLESFWIPSGSMENTLQINDRVIVFKLSYDLHSIHRGDVIVFNKPPAFVESNDKELIKRVVAVGGDTVQARGGSVYVDGVRQSTKNIDPVCASASDNNFGPVTIAKGNLWVMGDNRCDSSDSRTFGQISDSLVVGHAFARIWPVSRLGWL